MLVWPSQIGLTKILTKLFGAALFHHFKDPVMIVEGKMQYLYDEHQRRYLDVSFLFPLTNLDYLTNQTSVD